MTWIHNVRWLLWKEYRQHRTILFITLLLATAPYVLAALSAGWSHVWDMGSLSSLMLSQLAFALIGGTLIAGERADRSAEFQTYLPIPRRRLWGVKLCLPLAIAAAIWFLNAPPILWSGTFRPLFTREGLTIFAMIATAGLNLFCCAWLLSSVIKSSAISVCGGLTVSWLSFSIDVLAARHYCHLKIDPGEMGYAVILVFLLAESLICFAIGSWFFLRRVEP